MDPNILQSIEKLMPRYEAELPFSKEKVTFTPFRVKDAKNISIILQEENKGTYPLPLDKQMEQH